MAKAFGQAAFQAMEEQVRTTMSFFTEAMRMFSPFSQTRGEGKVEVSKPDEKAENGSDLDALKRQMADMQAKLDALSRK